MELRLLSRSSRKLRRIQESGENLPKCIQLPVGFLSKYMESFAGVRYGWGLRQTSSGTAGRVSVGERAAC
ncbi:unnamed protein product [Sphagnum tenellum]